MFQLFGSSVTNEASSVRTIGEAMRFGFRAVVGTFVVLTTLVQPTVAQEPPTAPHLFPEQTLAYIRIDQVDKLRTDFAASLLGQMAKDPQIQPLVGEFYSDLVGRLEQMEKDIGLNLDEFLSIPNGEVALAVMPPLRKSNTQQDADSAPPDRRPVFAFMLNAKDQVQKLQILIDKLKERNANRFDYTTRDIQGVTLHRYTRKTNASRQIGYFLDGSTIVCCTDSNYLEEFVAVWKGNVGERKTLADNRRFVSLITRCAGKEGERPQVTFYVDPLGLVRQLAPSDAGTQFTLAFLPALGLDGIEAFGGSWIFNGKEFDTVQHLHLLLGSPRKSVLGLLRPKAGTTTPQDWVPDIAAGYMTVNWDISSTMQGVEEIYDKFRGDNAFQEQVVAPANQTIGLDLRSDIVANMSGRFTMVSSFIRPIRFNSGSNAYAIEFRDAELLESKILPVLIEKTQALTSLQEMHIGAYTVYYYEMPVPDNFNKDVMRKPEFCFTVLDKSLVGADSLDVMRQLISAKDATAAPLSRSLEYEIVRDRIIAETKGKDLAALSYSRPEESFLAMYEGLRSPQTKEMLKSAGNPLATALSNAMEKHELPPFSAISRYLAPSGGYCIDEETGLHYTSFFLRR